MKHEKTSNLATFFKTARLALPASIARVVMLFGFSLTALSTVTAAQPIPTSPHQSGIPKVPMARIIGGQDSGSITPQLAMLLYRDIGDTRYIGCAGTLVGADKVLTAAHCVDDRRPAEVAFGKRSLNDTAGVTVAVKSVTVHSNFSLETLENDLAIITLASPVAITPVQLADAATTDSLYDGTKLTITGWGYTRSNFSLPASNVQSASVPLVANDLCSSRNIYGDLVDDSMICAGYLQGGADTCAGDSGGPLMIAAAENSDVTPILVGVVSWGSTEACGAPNQPGVYSRVASFKNWIEQQLLPPSTVETSIQSIRYGDRTIGIASLGSAKAVISISAKGHVVQNTSGGERSRIGKLRSRRGLFTLCDVDNDGSDDLVRVMGTNLQWYRHSGNGDALIATPKLSHPKKQAIPAASFLEDPLQVASGDVTQDGIDDLIIRTASRIQVFNGNGHGFDFYSTSDIASDALVVGQLQHDGPELIFARKNMKFERVPLPGDQFVDDRTADISTLATSSLVGVSTNYLLDIDEDGESELISILSNGYYWSVYRSEQVGGTFTSPLLWMEIPNRYQPAL